jgi:hypothetical protein
VWSVAGWRPCDARRAGVVTCWKLYVVGDGEGGEVADLEAGAGEVRDVGCGWGWDGK